MIRKRVTRRWFLGNSIAVGVLTSVLAACSSSPSAAPTTAPQQTAAPTSAPQPTSAAQPTTAPTSAPQATTAAAGQPTARPAATVAAASSAPAEIAFITTDSVDSSTALFKPVYDEFRKSHPEITVKWASVVGNGWADYFQKLAVMIAGGQQVDMSKIPTEGMRLAAARNLIVPLDDYIKATTSLNAYFNDVSPLLAKVAVFSGKTYGLPYDFNNMMIFFNTKRLKEENLELPPATWTFTDFQDYARKLTRKSGNTITNYGFTQGMVGLGEFGLDPFLFNNGVQGELGGPDMDQPTMSNPKYVEVIQMLHDMMWKDKTAPRLSTNENAQAEFEQGKVAMIGAGRWPVTGFLKDKFQDFAIQYWPKGTTRVTEVGCGFWPIYSASKVKEQAWTFEAFLLQPSSIRTLELGGSNIAALRSVANDPQFIKWPKNQGKLWYESIDQSNIPVESVVAPPDYGDMEDIVSRDLGTVFASDSPIQPGLQKLQNDLQAMVARRPPDWKGKFSA